MKFLLTNANAMDLPPVDINSLEDLLEFHKKNKCPLIIEIVDGEPEITLYDGFIE